MDTGRFITHSLRDPRVLRILAAAVDAVEPGAAVGRWLESHPLPAAERVFALAVGKAAAAMLEGLSGSVPLDGALAITKHAPGDFAYPIMEAGHPVPDERSLRAGSSALELAGRLGPDDLLICLISGGGSALMAAPRVPLEDLQTLTRKLLASGARIDEINLLRRHLDRVKGGGLARAANGARVLSLILSDVMGDPLEAIASGPTAPDPTTAVDALDVIARYGLEAQMPPGIRAALEETVKPGDPVFDRVENVIIGNNRIALEATLDRASTEGFHVEPITEPLEGEARLLGREFAKRLRAAAKRIEGPFCLAAGGETTVTLRGQGRGGRNQELALAAAQDLAEAEGVMLISLATDGEDGPTDAAGAVATGETLSRARAAGLDPQAALANNDSYPFFEALGDLIKTGPTGTNVNDLVLMLRV